MEKDELNEQEKLESEVAKLKKQLTRSQTICGCTLQWIEILEDRHSLKAYFEQHHCKSVAIYGASDLGRLLMKEVQGYCEVPCFIDRNAERYRVKWGIDVYTPEEYDKIPDVDMVVVTALASFDKVNEMLLEIRPEIPVVSLKVIINTLSDEVWYDEQ
jgi:FlaA1/EpsC-like NDP-sugar epimerase